MIHARDCAVNSVDISETLTPFFALINMQTVLEKLKKDIRIVEKYYIYLLELL
jgi:hypothetical protein